MGMQAQCAVSVCSSAQDLGCCFGQDTRELLMQGLPQDRVTVVDITPEYWCGLLSASKHEQA